jgi:dUTP pyrophosphatase
VGKFIKPMDSFEVKVYKCHPDAIIPERKSSEAAGYDLCAIEDFTLYPGDRVVVGTGLVIQPPPGVHTYIHVRSGMSFKHSLILINGVGVVDRDYGGPHDEFKVMLYRLPVNGEDGPLAFKKGDRIAQIVFAPTMYGKLVEVSEAPTSDRGGFGSTGVR